MDDRILTFAADVQKLTVRKELDKNFKKYNETTTIELQLFRESPQLLPSTLIHFEKERWHDMKLIDNILWPDGRVPYDAKRSSIRYGAVQYCL